MQTTIASAFVVCLVLLSTGSEAKVFNQCDFVRAIRGSFPPDQVSKWTCIAYHESRFNTDALNSNTGDHGIFQISQIYWCSTGWAPGGACHKRCADFHNDDIGDDIACVKQIWNEHQRLSGDGYNAWTVYRNHCRGDTSSWVAGC